MFAEFGTLRFDLQDFSTMANLHLVVDEDIKKEAKKIAQKKGKNLSALVEAYLFNLIREERGIKLSAELLDSPPLKSPTDYTKAREEYLDKKYGKS